MIEKLRAFIETYFKLETSFDELITIAEHVSTLFTNTIVFFLDRSAWVGEVFEKLNSFDQTGNSAHYIPFSSNFSSNFGRHGYYTFAENDLPNEEETRNLRIFLRSLGLDPEKNLSDYTNFGRRIVIASCVYKDGILASFLYFLLRWAE